MSTATAPPITAEEMLALPDSGMDRELVMGQLRERPMTTGNRRHTRTATKAANLLDLWFDSQPAHRGEILTGDAGFILHREPETVVGIDIAYVSADLARHTPEDVHLIDGAPVLAVEIPTPSDTYERIVEKIELFRDAGVRVVWIVDPDLETLTVYRSDAAPILFNAFQELAAAPDLPGLRIRIADLVAS